MHNPWLANEGFSYSLNAPAHLRARQIKACAKRTQLRNGARMLQRSLCACASERDLQRSDHLGKRREGEHEDEEKPRESHRRVDGIDDGPVEE